MESNCGKELREMQETYARESTSCMDRRLAEFDNATLTQLGFVCDSYGFADFNACLAPGAMESKIQERCREEADLPALDKKAAECLRKK